MAKRMLADVLWEAANEHLPPSGGGTGELSCNAIGKVFRPVHGYWINVPESVNRFLLEMGCDVYCGGGLFQEFPAGKERQGIRYVWLLLAMHVAEDEGIEVGA